MGCKTGLSNRGAAMDGSGSERSERSDLLQSKMYLLWGKTSKSRETLQCFDDVWGVFVT